MSLYEKVNKFVVNKNFLPWELWHNDNGVWLSYLKDEAEEYNNLVKAFKDCIKNNPLIFKGCIFKYITGKKLYITIREKQIRSK